MKERGKGSTVGLHPTCCWGWNNYGQLGDNTLAPKPTPVAVSTSLVTSFQSGSLVAGLYHTCGLAASGAAYCWGYNADGQLGDGTTTQRSTPVAASTSLITSFLGGSLVAGGFDTCGLAASGKAYCWGADSLPPHVLEKTRTGALGAELRSLPDGSGGNSTSHLLECRTAARGRSGRNSHGTCPPVGDRGVGSSLRGIAVDSPATRVAHLQ